MPDAVTVARQDSHMVQGGCNAVQSAGQTRLTFEPLDAPFGVVVRGVEWSDGPPDRWTAR